MKRTLGLAALAIAAAQSAVAGGIDQSGQDVSLIFEPGTQVRLSYGKVSPELSGADIAAQPTGNVAAAFAQTAFAFKTDVSDRLSLGLTWDQPFGADVTYGATSPVLGGTRALAESSALTALARLRLSDRFSLLGGLRMQTASASVGLAGLAYAGDGIDGYAADLAAQTRAGAVLGAAFEIPDIALRAALTWNSAIDYDFATTERLGATIIGIAPTPVSTPQSVNLDLQTGIAADTLLFGQVRWVDWSSFRLKPATLGADLIDLSDSTTWTLGLGHRFSAHWSGLASVSYEQTGDPRVSPLAPSTGQLGATLGVVYTADRLRVTLGVNSTRLGAATPAIGTPKTQVASFGDGSVTGIGLRIDYGF